jgi:hypothetical protein
MSKIITSPVKKWPGTVTLSDPLTYPQRFAYEDAVDALAAYRREVGDDNVKISRANYLLLPGILACVEKWELANLPAIISPETFPASPAMSAAKLLSWLITEVVALFEESEDIPLA